jgi:cytochrome c553
VAKVPIAIMGTEPRRAGLAAVRVSLLLVLAALTATACDRPVSRTDQALTATGRVTAMSGGAGGPANACFACHGLDGEGDGVSVPRLAGLDAGYLQKQMEDYASGIRPDPVMTAVAKALDDDARRAVVAYYAGLKPKVSIADMSPAPVIWRDGDPARGLTACASCHGAEGEGVGQGQPVLAGQPQAYTREQMDRWRAGKRRNDPRAAMTDIARKLTSPEVDAVAAWLERRPASPAPASDAASASAAAAAAGRSAASREGRRLDR